VLRGIGWQFSGGFNDRARAGRFASRVFLLREEKPKLKCTLVDISETGARLVVDDVSEVPDRFIMAMIEPRSAPAEMPSGMARSKGGWSQL
jgi:hypothetical protein